MTGKLEARSTEEWIEHYWRQGQGIAQCRQSIRDKTGGWIDKETIRQQYVVLSRRPYL